MRALRSSVSMALAAGLLALPALPRSAAGEAGRTGRRGRAALPVRSAPEDPAGEAVGPVSEEPAPRAGGPAPPVEAARAEPPAEAPSAAPQLREWLPSRGRQCRRYRGRRVCDGPRMAPRPRGAQAELAARLGLGSRRAGAALLLGPPEPEWVQAVEGEPPDRLLWPVQGGKLWRGFGRVRHRGRRRVHKGVDIGAPAGTPILAAADGLVAYSDNGARGYGNLLVVVHADGTAALYAHCRATYFFPGQQVRRGQVIGEVGTTGITRGAHLHFELRVEGEPVDPLPRFEATPPRARRAGAPAEAAGAELAQPVSAP